MPPKTLFAQLLNHLFAAQTTALLERMHIQPLFPATPITDTFAMELFAFTILIAVFIVVRLTLRVETPSPFQHLFEITHEFVREQSESIIGHGFERYTSFLTALLLFILLSNLMGLVPGLESPTADKVMPLGLALVTFIYYHFHGVRANRLAYVKQFLGPVWWLYPLLLPVEIISYCARVLSLTVRVYANMYAGDWVTRAFFSLVPIGLPVIFLGLHLGVAVVQAYVFFLLATIYLSLATAHDH